MTSLTPEEKAKARNDALMRLPTRFQPTSNPETIRSNVQESASIASTDKLFHTTPEAIHDEQRKDTIEKYTAENEQAVIKAKMFEAEYTEASFRATMETLAPFQSDKRLRWCDCVTDSETGQKSPSMQQLLKEQYPAIADVLAITDVRAFKAKIADKYSNHRLIWKLDRWSFDGGREKFSEKDRYFESIMCLLVVRR